VLVTALRDTFREFLMEVKFCVSPEVSTVVIVHIAVFGVVTPCSFISGTRYSMFRVEMLHI
jgi:hypothetical protein